MDLKKVLNMIQSAVNSIELESFSTWVFRIGFFNGLFNSNLHSISDNSTYKNPVYAEDF